MLLVLDYLRLVWVLIGRFRFDCCKFFIRLVPLLLSVWHVGLSINELAHKVPFLVWLRLLGVLAWLCVQLRRLSWPFHQVRSWLLRLCLCHYRHSNFVLTFGLSWGARVHNLNLICVGVSGLLEHLILGNDAWWLHIEVAWLVLVLAVIVNAWLIEILIEVLHWVVHIRIRVLWPHSAHSHLVLILDQVVLTTHYTLVVILIK